jgi:hypothetical protein
MVAAQFAGRRPGRRLPRRSIQKLCSEPSVVKTALPALPLAACVRFSRPLPPFFAVPCTCCCAMMAVWSPKTVAETDGAAEMQAYRAGFATEPF